MNSARFKIEGMDCAEEVAILRRAVGPVVGSDDRLAFDILNGRMIVAGDVDDRLSTAVVEAVRATGMRAEPWRSESAAAPAATGWVRHRRTGLTSVSGLFLLGGFSSHAIVAGGVIAALGSEGLGIAHSVPLVSRVLYGLAIVCGGWFVAPKALYSARQLRPDMNLLMTIAVLGAIGIGEWLEAATVAFLFSLSLAIESWSVGRARRAIEALMDLSPPIAHVRDNGVIRDMKAEDVPVGSIFVVKPGERIPLDGVVTSGASSVNQAPITGESLPVPKEVGATVFAGTINGDGAIDARSTKPVGDTTLAHIVTMVGEASRRRAPSEQWVERFARIYTPVVLVAAVFVLLIPPLLFSAEWTVWLYRSLVLLVIGCPCALVISTPVTIVAALAAAARHGVLIKGGAYVEAPARLHAIAMDKTGTLTKGEPEVVEVVALAGHTPAEVLAIAAGMEAHSDHPLARAIARHAVTTEVTGRQTDRFQIIQGKGATAWIDGSEYWLGSHRYLQERRQETADIRARLDRMSAGGRSVVVVGNDQHVCGLIAIADTIRPETPALVESLRAAGVAHVVMLTGDNRATADAIAARSGILEVRAELLPGDKLREIERLTEQYGTVAMVGDGVNDAPAMARATLGIAMGAAGSDAAIETADIALMSDDLTQLPWLIRHSKRALGIIRENITLALGVKAVFVVLTFAGFASLWAAIAADMGVSLLVIFNALRIVRPVTAADKR